MHGILNIDKPYGITSMEVVRRVKRASGQKRVGHAGTLDPIATGVIPVCIGQATRVTQYLNDGRKEYEAQIELGVTTDTYDAMGEVLARCDPGDLSESDILTELKSFEGSIEQVPPMYSALKRDGKRLYELARAGIEVEREPRQVQVYGITLLELQGHVARVLVSCGKGFYMRSLAFDLGQALGCGGHLKSLIRTKSGPFKVEDAISLEEAEDALENSDWQGILNPPDVVLSSMRATIVGSKIEDMVRNGRALPQGLRIPNGRANEKCRAYSVDGRFIAILTFDATLASWRPEKVFSSSAKEAAPVA
ncbi:MAG: tRNA pseudouridine(55) synthase TruB [Chloroflexi bacterium]|nr:tRNA pseudouridine(55) synthase TruB [Chloroflexota bacterium]